MAAKFTGKEKKGEHEARELVHKEDFCFHGAEPPIEPTPRKRKK